MIVPIEEKEILIEEPNKTSLVSKELRKEILILHKLGLKDYEIRYLLTLKLKEKIKENWKNN